jgi:hypothetical protein
MELTPGVVVISVAVVVVVGFVLIRWGRRQEAAAPVEPAHRTVKNNFNAARGPGESQALVNWLLARADEETGIRVSGDSLARERIEQAAAKAVEELRSAASTTISLPFLAADARGPKHFAVDVRRNADGTYELVR